MDSKVKKPFYKRVWFWVVVVIVVIIAASSMGGSKSTNSTNKSTSSSKTSGKTISQSDFESLTVGDLSNNGSGGTSYADAIKLLGKPTTSGSSSTSGQSTETDTWSNLGGDYSSIVLMFGGDGDSRALTSKSYLSTKSVLSSTKISSTDYDSIATDGSMTYDDAVSKFGKPAQLTVTSLAGSNSSVAIWTNVGSGITSGVSLTFSGENTVISKTQTGVN